MPVVHPLPIEIAIPEIPSHMPQESEPKWTEGKPKTWTHPDIPQEIVFPVSPRKTVFLPLKISVHGNVFEVNLALTAIESAQLETYAALTGAGVK